MTTHATTADAHGATCTCGWFWPPDTAGRELGPRAQAQIANLTPFEAQALHKLCQAFLEYLRAAKPEGGAR